MIDASHRGFEEAATQAQQDLVELDEQLTVGEIDEATGMRLRERYLADLRVAEEGLRESTGQQVPARSTTRMIIGAAVLILGIGIAVGIVGNFIQTPDDATLNGVAANPDFDPENFSNETLEATLRSFEDKPEALRETMPMRFRLAERYFEAQEFDRAFDHYTTIIQSDPDPELGSAALTRVAWIVWVANGLTDLALETVEKALNADPDNVEASYVKAQIVWCGLGDTDTAVPLLETVLASPLIDDAVRQQVLGDLELAQAGRGCA